MTKAKNNGKNNLHVEARIVEVLPNLMFRIELSNGHRSLARLASNMRLNFIQVLPGDKVLIDFYPYDLTRGRIIEKLQSQDE